MKYNTIITILLLTLLTPLSVFAADYVPLVGIPGLSGGADQNFGEYINALYRLMISIGALIAVVKIVGAGAKYMLSDIVTSKSQAIKDIRGAVLGLLIVIGAVVILNTINADIVNTSLTFTEVGMTPPPPPELTEAEEALEALCAVVRGSSCTVQGCTIGIFQSCADWCEETMHGYIYSSGLGYTNCIVKDPISIACTDQVDADGVVIIDYSTGNPAKDCTAAESECSALGGESTDYGDQIVCEGWDYTLAS